jgi:serine protein kinase
MSLLDRLQSVANEKALPHWSGTFADFVQQIVASGKYPNLGDLAHRRIYNMIMSYGTETMDFFGKKRTRYKFVEDHFYGIETSIDQIMSFLHSAANQTESSRRMLLLWGPPGTGKSDTVAVLKRGLEAYSRTDQGAIFALQGCKMHENPLHLVPQELRRDFEKEYGVRIEGYLNPYNRYRLEHEYNNDFMKFPVERIFISEADRCCIGTWVPTDPKSADQSELVGSIDYAKIQEVGDESHPLAYSFSGELNVANRGLMEFVEGLKSDERFLRVLLTATQEKQIKAPRFGMIYCDELIILHTNEGEFRSFMGEKKYEAYHDRMTIIRMPHICSVAAEVKLYEKLLQQSAYNRSIHIAPHTLKAAAMFAVLSRLEEPEGGDLTIQKKMKLYDGEHVQGFKIDEVPDIKERFPDEGMSGVSPRFAIDMIIGAITKAANEGRSYITALDALRQINDGVTNRDVFSKEQKNSYKELVHTAREEWDELLQEDIQKAFFVSFEDDARALCENYLDQIEAVTSGKKFKDPVTGKEKDPDEKLMRAIEDQIGVSNSGRDDFRSEILRAFASAARKGRKFDYTEHAQLREAIQKHLFTERKGVIRMTVSTRNPEPEAEKRLNAVIERMVDQYGYTVESAKALLQYATSHLFDK